MIKKYLLPAILAALALFTISTSAQTGKFEGFNIILDAPQTQRVAACALRYAPSNSFITIADLDPSTPMDVTPCEGSGTNLSVNGSTASMQANPGTNKWCFKGKDKKYRISFNGDQYTRRVIYDWIATPENPGFYDIKDFGAVGDGRTDDSMAIRSALAFIATRNGGTLRFSDGEYIVGNSPDYNGLTLPSGIVIEGTNALQSENFSNNYIQKNPSRITLVGANKAVFRIGECTERVVIKDIELFAQSNQDTYGIEAFGAYTSAQDIYLERVTFSKFFRGIYAYGLPVTDKNWQFDYVKLNHVRFMFNRDAGLYVDVRNSDWKIQSSLFINPKKAAGTNANSMHFERVAGVLIEDTYGGGFAGAPGGTFINILDSGPITVITSQTEAMTRSLVYNQVENPYAGDYSYPIMFVNSVFGNPIEFKARRTFVSTGSVYLANTFIADNRLRVYSTGDRFCYDGATLGCQGTGVPNMFDKATVVFMTGQPGERGIPDRPTFFGTDVEFGAPVKMPNFTQDKLPTGKPNGSMVYCSNCRRNTQTCSAGGSGAPAMVVNGQWSCL
ncbi:MAG: hypothetical protein KIS76_04495 [Pyrinomonadaceae bacterium]|nr:hypothetical protein [Pyrinomonadaceae bacterium]